MKFHLIPFHFDASLFALALILCPARSDPDPLQDYCVVSINHDGPSQRLLFHKWHSLHQSETRSAWTLSNIRSVQDRKSNIPFEFSVTLTDTLNLPGISTMGLSMARVNIAAHGLVPPHSRPRAPEMIICLAGVIHMGFVDSSNRLFTQILRTGESFVFPRGLIHYMYNNIHSTRPALSLSGFRDSNFLNLQLCVKTTNSR